MSFVITEPYQFIAGLDGEALDAGTIYYGEPNLDPIQYPKSVYYDVNMTIPAPQPLRTVNGYIVRNGTPTFLFASGNYSVLVLDKKGRQVYYVPDFMLIGNAIPLTRSQISAPVTNIAGLKALDKTQYAFAQTSGYYTSGDGGAGRYYYDAADTTSLDNGGTIIVATDGGRWKLILDNDSINLKQFGAKGDWNGTTGTDDSTAIQSCFSVAAAAKLWVDGANGFYKLLSTVTVNDTAFKLRNCRFATSNVYTSQGQIVLNVTTAELRSIYVDGGRGTYKTGNETWVTFGSFNGYSSIQPSLGDFIKINTYTAGAAARVTLDCVNFDNIFATACVNINTYGTAQISNCSYRNIANTTFANYHSADNGVTVAGRTEANNVYAENVGLLPSNFNVNGSPTTFAASTAFPQGSFNYLVSFGDYTLNNAVVWNYAATAFTADRNTSFVGNNIYVMCDATNAVSNNPSGAFWLEACNRASLSNATVNIQARDSRDYAVQESSALQIFLLEDQQCELSNIVIKGNTTSAVTNRAIRISSAATTSAAGNEINATNIHVDGLYSSGNAMTAFLSANTVIGSKYRFNNMNIASGNIILDPMRIMEFTQMQSSGSITMQPAGNPGVTGSVALFGIRQSNTGAVSVTCSVPGSLSLNDNDTIGGAVSITNCSGQASVSGNNSVAGSISINSTSPTSGAFKICNNTQSSGTITVPNAKSAIVSGNMTTRQIVVSDVQTFNITGNTAKTDQPESILLINPSVSANVLAGVTSSNNLLIKTGTVGASYITIAGGVVGVTDVNNNKLTVNWS